MVCNDFHIVGNYYIVRLACVFFQYACFYNKVGSGGAVHIDHIAFDIVGDIIVEYDIIVVYGFFYYVRCLAVWAR